MDVPIYIYTFYLKPLSLMRVTSPRIASDEASRYTVRRRSNELAQVRDRLSGGASAFQHHDEMRVLSVEERQALLTSSDFNVKLTCETALAMKLNLMIPWKKMRMMRR